MSETSTVDSRESRVESPATDPIGRALRRRVPARTAAREARAVVSEYRAARQGAMQVIRLYDGGTRAEIAAAATCRKILAQRTKEFRGRVRAAALERVGRRIDLIALLSASRRDGSPAWTVADPMADPYTGGYVHYMSQPGGERGIATWRSDAWPGTICGQSVVVDAEHTIWLEKCHALRRVGGIAPVLRASGMPPLPPEARALVRAKTIRRRAAWVGVLYQPTAWEELPVNPDPAIVVEWIDRPGEYYCLAVWGGDRASIMEFVD